MECQQCRTGIDDDSFYCDQCGEEIRVCPTCGRFGAKQRCKYDGAQLVAAKERGAPAESGAGVPVAVPLGGDAPATFAAAPATATPSVLTLINRNLGADLTPVPGDLLGRAQGRFAEILGGFPRISSRHAQISYDPTSGWSVTDLGSTNGTTVDGVPLSPNYAHAVRDGASLVLGKSVEFYVRVEGPTNSAPLRQAAAIATPTGTVRL